MLRQGVDASPHSQPAGRTGNVGTLNRQRSICDLHTKRVFRMRCGSADVHRVPDLSNRLYLRVKAAPGSYQAD